MRALVQRVTRAHVDVVGGDSTRRVGQIGPGLVALVGATHADTAADATALAAKVANLRIFDDEDGTPNLSALDVTGEVLVVSQFTLYADTRKGRRPSYLDAAKPEVAEPLVEAMVAELQELGLTCQTGQFRARMQVELCNDGPMTFLVEVPAP